MNLNTATPHGRLLQLQNNIFQIHNGKEIIFEYTFCKNNYKML